ncbi:Antitoxin Phd_YefM, type II toxin-antitoxin system [Neomoorella glycerini]|uniref:Antitoxin n=1 Tax=Neomoorella glycerini TaxID=55779 RepID=A0A6I5ZUQ0_9FIRM|nr:type II toxin-antitoxin system prevent-host-death family antitoxin [Moorella glycerini]QGP93359.1 Antitoxin Phd_YefM, type II toxin-antitoxin system [Moorella glycerini]
MMSLNVTQAKESFLDLIRRVEGWESVILEKRGKPVAALLPYEEYANLSRIKNYLAMQEISEAMKDSGITAEEIFQASRQELEAREK